MILQIGGVGNLIVGITAAAAVGSSNNAQIRDGKFDFRYQWHYIELSVTAWRNLRKERYKHYSS